MNLSAVAFTIVTCLLILSSGPVYAAGNPTNTLAPIRQVKGRVKLKKVTIAKQADGSYGLRDSTVCQKDVLVSLFDIRNLKGGYQWTVPNIIECDSDINGEPAKLQASGTIVLKADTVFDGDPSADLRTNNFELWSSTASNPRRFHANTQTMSKDVNSAALMEASERFRWDCSPGSCAPSLTEFFSASIEYGP